MGSEFSLSSSVAGEHESEATEKMVLENDFCRKLYSKRILNRMSVWIDATCDLEEVCHLLGEDLRLFGLAAPLAFSRLLDEQVALWVNQDFCYPEGGEELRPGGACAHFSPSWLESHGNLSCKAQAVEIYCWSDYLKGDLQRVGMLAHELAHCYHCLLGWEQPDICQSFAQSMASGIYQCVPHCAGHEAKAYATTNCKEFFASLSVPFLGFCNDWYPFIRADLESFDPPALCMLQKVWAHCPGGTVGAGCSRTPPPVTRCSCGGAFVVGRSCRRCWKSSPQSPLGLLGRALRIEAEGQTLCGSAEGIDVKAWRLEDEGDFWRIVAVVPAGGPELCLDLSNPDRVAMVRRRQKVSGQLWRLVEVPGGYHLETMWTGHEQLLCLRHGKAHMRAKSDIGKASCIWKIAESP